MIEDAVKIGWAAYTREAEEAWGCARRMRDIGSMEQRQERRSKKKN